MEHVFNVLGTMASCPTYFCLSPHPPAIELNTIHHGAFHLSVNQNEKTAAERLRSAAVRVSKWAIGATCEQPAEISR